VNSIEGIISSLYTNYLLRDVAAKIIPGSLTLLTLPLYRHGLRGIQEIVANFGFAEWIFSIGAAWILSYSIQTIGELTHLLRQWPAVLDDFDERYEFRALFGTHASDRERRLVERYVVIKESCGIGYLAIWVSIVLVLCQFVLDFATGIVVVNIEHATRAGAVFGVPFAGLLLASLLLRASHFRHLKRQYAQMGAVLKSHGKKTPKFDSDSAIFGYSSARNVSKKAESIPSENERSEQ